MLGKVLGEALDKNCGDAFPEYTAEVWQYIVQMADPDFDHCDDNGALNEVLLRQVVNDMLEDLRNHRYPRQFACYINRELLERLGNWTPWQMLQAYLTSEDLAPIIIFWNEPHVFQDDQGGESEFYAMELRIHPTYAWKK